MRTAAEADRRFRDWSARLEASGTQIVSVNDFLVVRRGGRTFASFVDTVLRTSQGEILPRCMLLRGDSVVVVPVLDCEGIAHPLTLMVEQFRPVDGGSTLEFVGGMIDDGDEPATCAVKEVREEIGLEVEAGQLVPLTLEPIRVCTAMMDERVHFFAFRMALTRAQAGALDGKALGDVAAGESIVVRLVDFAVAAQQPVFSAQVGVRLVQSLLAASV